MRKIDASLQNWWSILEIRDLCVKSDSCERLMLHCKIGAQSWKSEICASGEINAKDLCVTTKLVLNLGNQRCMRQVRLMRKIYALLQNWCTMFEIIDLWFRSD